MRNYQLRFIFTSDVIIFVGVYWGDTPHSGELVGWYVNTSWRWERDGGNW